MQDVMNNPAAAVSTDGSIKSPRQEYPAINNALQNYLSAIGRYPLLSKKQQLALAKQVHQDDLDAKEQLINCNLRLVVSIAKEYQHRNMPLLDLIDEGNLGLIHATTKFQPELGYAFSTYACYWIRHKIERALVMQSKLIRLPINKHKELNRYLRCSYQFQHRYGYWPKPEEIEELTPSEQRKFTYLMQFNQDAVSLDMPLAEDNSLSLNDVLTVEESPSCYSTELDKKTALNFLFASIQQLSPLQKRVIQFRFGLHGCSTCTLAELAAELQLSSERVRQIQNQALKKLHEIFEEKGFAFDDVNLFD